MEDKYKAQSEKIKSILAKLENQNNRQIQKPEELKIAQEKTNTEKFQTVSDDFESEISKEEMIIHYESIIRKALSLFDINYDDLIRMDKKSAYCKAIEFYPHLLDEVKKAECPPLMALQIAKAMQPYLEFTQKYGSSLDEIKQALKEEILQEKDLSKKQKNDNTFAIKENVENAETKKASIFADIDSAIKQKGVKQNNPSKEEGLDFLFAN